MIRWCARGADYVDLTLDDAAIGGSATTEQRHCDDDSDGEQQPLMPLLLYLHPYSGDSSWAHVSEKRPNARRLPRCLPPRTSFATSALWWSRSAYARLGRKSRVTDAS
eukprot:890610-Prorocentrum_minimum.AAC.2